MKIYKSCNTLPIRRFFRVFSSNDYRNLIIGFDEENDSFELSDKRKGELEEIFKDIYYEYAELTNNHKLKAIFVKKFLIAKWEFIHTMIINSMYFYYKSKDIEFLKSINKLEEPEYVIDFDKPIDPQAEVFVGKMKGLKNKIKIFKIKLNKTPLNKEEPKKVDLDKAAIYLERHLELKRPVDPDTTSVNRWIHLTNMSADKNKQDARTKS
jgi:hypothetical protein